MKKRALKLVNFLKLKFALIIVPAKETSSDGLFQMFAALTVKSELCLIFVVNRYEVTRKLRPGVRESFRSLKQQQ